MTASFEGLSSTDAMELLRTGELAVAGRLVDASNATLYCTVSASASSSSVSASCVYKPVAGERPLWDFPDGTLAGREVAAFAVSEAFGWSIVPPTVYRDGPFGEGMCQLWVERDPAVDLVELSRDREHPALCRMAVFDAVINNSDRKIGHLLPTSDGRLYGCDHGVSFAEDYKLRTVLWQWQGEPLTNEMLAGLESVRAQARDPDSELAERLARHLTGPERFAVRRRVELLLEHKVHPFPPPGRPAIPWPPI
ncbi:putative repeat protein (TIGR03843 family) [Lipingzhangella halophila]|uniref:Putative repeat protein (TIGR03843 family) n=1 Tax=Lipingzhangella halophila TaxID=1783352 RepID=A0A7W7RHG6_9ACTN|nr:SCO1664 family protein [Lipingzhangella halophila]MBB4932076.1 putative repeat protein (TIGR03843 family) [Lipingzhangella halophila]